MALLATRLKRTAIWQQNMVSGRLIIRKPSVIKTCDSFLSCIKFLCGEWSGRWLRPLGAEFSRGVRWALPMFIAAEAADLPQRINQHFLADAD